MLDFAELTLSWRPNQYLVAPAGLCRRAQPHRESPRFAAPPDELARQLDTALEDEPRLAWLRRDSDGLGGQLVQRSRLFRFPDLIDLRILPEGDGGSTLAIYSRARYGIRDFGVNRERVERWLARLH
jgi:uncharacterized protein (DUF1499 family)